MTPNARAGPEGDLTGRVRMSVPTTYGHYRLPPLLARFAQHYPRAQVELNITNRNVDLIAEGFDLAIRPGQLPDSGLVARKLEDAALLLVASPDYLHRMGSPQTLEELHRHTCLPFIMPRTGRIAPGCFVMRNVILTGCRVQLSKSQTMYSAWFRWRSRGWGSARAMIYRPRQDTARSVSRGAATPAWTVAAVLRALCATSTPVGGHPGDD